MSSSQRSYSRGSDVTIIVVSYNTREMTLECLRSIPGGVTRGETVQVVVFDNQSTDGSPEAIGREFPQYKLVVSSQNLGFARANNQASRLTRTNLLLLLNPDTIVLPGAISKLLCFSKDNPHAGIWGGRTNFADGTINPGSCWSKQTLWSLLVQALGFTSLFRNSQIFNPEGIGGWDRRSERSVDIVSGCFLLIKRDLWERLNGFDEHFFMYGEEADLCLRAAKLGYRPCVTPHATIVHYGGASEGVAEDKICKLLAAKASLIERHFKLGTRLIGRLLLACWPCSRALALSLAAVFGSVAVRSRASTWRSIFKRRREWFAGYNGKTY